MIPTRHIYRAFRELDSIPDDQCRRFLRRVRLQQTWGTVLPRVIMAIVIGTAAAWLIGRVVYRWVRPEFIHEQALAWGVMVGVVGGVFVGAIAGLMLRDVQLWLGLRRELRRTCCPKCRYPLLGLPIHRVGFGAPLPGDAKVRCSECGTMTVLSERGLAPHDLVPWEQRGVPEDFARVRKASGRDRGW